MAVASSTQNHRARLGYDERRTQILACARRLFAERGYDAVSTTEIAREAGIARGLIHHYFGSKRELYLEAVRSMLAVPADFFANLATQGTEPAMYEAVDRWLDMAERNRKLVTAVAAGFGNDPEFNRIVRAARERDADGVVAILEPDPAKVTPQLRALVEAYSAFVVRATVDYIEGRGFDRVQLRELLVHGMLCLHREVLPRVEQVGTARPPATR